jgi:hypothetical protein
MNSCLAVYVGLATWLSSLPASGPIPVPVGASLVAVYQLPGGLRAQVHGSDVVITNGAGVVVARNSHLIRREDEDQSCPSEGFERIVSKGDYFTIEQQTCGGWFLVNEYITFRYLKASGKIVLHKYGRVPTDRRDPNKVMPTELYTAKQLGQFAFAQVTKASLDAVGR